MKENFYDDNDLTVLPNGNLRDENFEEYELEEERVDFIVYMPEGMKGKRAYIKTDGENYLAWSGPIVIADKSRFLRGDFEKAKEESQPIEEATVQEQEPASKPCTFCQGKGCNFCGGSGKAQLVSVELHHEGLPGLIF